VVGVGFQSFLSCMVLVVGLCFFLVIEFVYCGNVLVYKYKIFKL